MHHKHLGPPLLLFNKTISSLLSRLQRQFKRLLEENHQVTPGKSLQETYVYFVGKDVFNGLEEGDRLLVYEQHQQELRQKAKHDFQELLWEQSQVFLNLNPTGRVTNDDLKGITNALQDDPRFVSHFYESITRTGFNTRKNYHWSVAPVTYNYPILLDQSKVVWKS